MTKHVIRMLRIFSAKEVPWVVGLIAGMLAWTVTHIVDRLTSAPLISFELEQPLTVLKGPDGKTVLTGSFIVRNLTRETAFRHARFQVYAGYATDVEGHLEAVKGSFVFAGESFQAKINSVKEAGEFVLTYDLPEMQPHQAWRLHFKGLRVDRPVLSLRMSAPPPDPDAPPPPVAGTSTAPGNSANISQKEALKDGEATSLAAVQLVQRNWETYLVDHEIVILATLACLFSVVLVLSLFFLRIPESAPAPAVPSPITPSSTPPVPGSLNTTPT